MAKYDQRLLEEELKNKVAAELTRMFVVPANTFDNVKGEFPIGFKVWRVNGRAVSPLTAGIRMANSISGGRGATRPGRKSDVGGRMQMSMTAMVGMLEPRAYSCTMVKRSSTIGWRPSGMGKCAGAQCFLGSREDSG